MGGKKAGLIVCFLFDLFHNANVTQEIDFGEGEKERDGGRALACGLHFLILVMIDVSPSNHNAVIVPGFRCILGYLGYLPACMLRVSFRFVHACLCTCMSVYMYIHELYMCLHVHVLICLIGACLSHQYI